MTEERIKAISFKCDEVGKYMKGSKKRFEWVVGLSGRTHTIVLDFSFISGKVKAFVDGRVLLENEIPLNTSFQHPFTLDGFALNLIQQGQNCELRINNKVFSHLYTQEKTNQEFKQDESEFGISMNKDFMNKINTGGNKITLDIGGQKKNFAKKNKQDEGEWGAFGGIGFPSGFEAPPGMEVPQQKGSTGFGSEFDVPSNTEQSAPIDFFGDAEPSKTASTGIVDNSGGDLLSGDTPAVAQPTTTPTTQPSIESLYQTSSMMNTNQLLFNTGLQQQQYMQQQGMVIGGINPLIGGSVPGATASLPFNTGLGLNQMFATGVPNAAFGTNINIMSQPSSITMNTGMGLSMTTNAGTAQTPANTGLTNPNFQVGTSFQTGNINLNQLYQTGVQVSPASISDLTSLTTAQQQHAGMMFPTTAGTIPTSGMTFNTTVPTAPSNKDVFDLM